MEGPDLLQNEIKTELDENWTWMEESEPLLLSEIKTETEEDDLLPVDPQVGDDDDGIQPEIKIEKDDDDTLGDESALLPQEECGAKDDLLSDEPQSQRQQQRACRRRQVPIKSEEEETNETDEEEHLSWAEEDEDEDDSCNICESEFSTKEQLDQHRKTRLKNGDKNQVKKRLGNDKPVRCDLCDYTCARIRNLFVHTQREHPEEKKSFKCSFQECDHVADTKQQLKRHILTHMGPKNHVCPTCGYTCLLSNDLVVHLHRHEDLKSFKCSFPDCSYASAHMGHVKRHEKIHIRKNESDNKASIVEFSCTICDYSTDQRSNLKRHLMATHSNKTLFKCGRCNYTGKTKDLLAQHLRTFPEHRVQSEETKNQMMTATDLQLSRKPAWRKKVAFWIDLGAVCAIRTGLTNGTRTLRQSSSLSGEDMEAGALERTENGLENEVPSDSPIGPRATTCEICNRSFRNRPAKSKHMQTHKAPWVCPICGQSINRSYNVERHKNTHLLNF